MDYTDSQSDDGASDGELSLSAGLRTLDIEGLRISYDFRPELIRKLVLSNNAFITLPSNIVQFTQLEELDISSNGMGWITGEIAQLQYLTVLQARNNRLSNLPKEFQNCQSLRVVNLSGNLFTDVPPQIFDLHALRKLYMGGNKISELPPQIQNLKRLELLYLGGNELREIAPYLSKLKNLRHLFLCDNRLESIPKELGQLKYLESLSLHKNAIKTLPVEILLLTNMQELTLRDNPLVSTFIKKLEFSPPSLAELCGRVIKTQNIKYGPKSLPRHLIVYLNSAKKCVNPKCAGVYFDSRVKCVQFVDFCGRFRLPLEQYLCSPNEHEGDSSSVDAGRLQKVLLPQNAD